MESQSTANDQQSAHEPKHVKVTVTFPLAHKEPYHADDPPDATVGSVLSAAMTHFEVSDDDTTKYYLTHKHERADPNATLEQLADDARAVKFTLAKEITQG